MIKKIQDVVIIFKHHSFDELMDRQIRLNLACAISSAYRLHSRKTHIPDVTKHAASLQIIGLVQQFEERCVIVTFTSHPNINGETHKSSLQNILRETADVKSDFFSVVNLINDIIATELSDIIR